MACLQNVRVFLELFYRAQLILLVVVNEISSFPNRSLMGFAQENCMSLGFTRVE